MALRLTLIAHAATCARKTAAFSLDEPIETTPEATPGLHGLKRLAGRTTRFFHGPELRTRQTAALLASNSEVDEALRDCDLGEWKGRALEALLSREAQHIAAWMADWEATPHGGESIAQLYQRVGAWMDALTGTGHLVAVTHPFVIRAALMRVLQCPPQAFHAIDVEPLAAVDLRFNGTWRLRALSLLAGG